LHIGTDTRTGWPSYAPWGPDGEILCHYYYVEYAGPIKFYKRENKGEGEWIETILDPPDGYAIVWHTMITSGENHEYIHLLALTYSPDLQYEGQDNALLYYRSSDGAETWEIEAEIIEGLGSDYFPTINSLSYAWANPVGETIAFTYGFDEYGGRVFKSTDNGDSWEMIEVMETTIDPFAPPTDSPDIPCGIGSSACVLDSEGNVHLVFPRMVKYWEAETLYYQPFTDGLIYWNESMPILDTNIISSYTLEFLEAAGNLCGYVMSSSGTYTIPADQPNYANASCGFPHMAIDSEDNIFVVTSMLAPDYIQVGTNFIYRHIVLNRSFDQGVSWEGQIDLNEDVQYIFSECAYPVIAPALNGYVHLLFQEDAFPGTYEWPGPSPSHPLVENNMMHMAIDKGLLGVGIEDNTADPNLEVSVYPNPASDAVFVQIELKKAGNIAISLLDQLGRTVITREMGTFNQGNHRVSLDISSLSPGVYYLQTATAGEKMTQKVVVR
jgi:hypothetical protein